MKIIWSLCFSYILQTNNPVSMTGLENIQAEILSDNRRINSELLADADQVGILDVIPLRNLHVVDTEALTDSAQDIAGCHCVDDVITVVYEASVGILPAAGHVLEFFLVDVVGHFCNLLYVICFLQDQYSIWSITEESHLYVCSDIFNYGILIM